MAPSRSEVVETNAWYGIPEDELIKMPGFRETADGKKHPDDIAMARALLEEAGVGEGWYGIPIKMPGLWQEASRRHSHGQGVAFVGEGFGPTLIYPIIFEHPGIAAIFQNQINEFLGWDMEIRGLEIATWLQQRNELQYDLINFGYGIVAHDPHDLLGGVFVKDGASNYSKWSDPRIEDIFLRQARELDRVKRKALIDEATRIFMEEDSPVIFMYHTVRGHYSALQIQNHHPVGTLTDALKAEHLWCDPAC